MGDPSRTSGLTLDRDDFSSFIQNLVHGSPSYEPPSDSCSNYRVKNVKSLSYPTPFLFKSSIDSSNFIESSTKRRKPHLYNDLDEFGCEGHVENGESSKEVPTRCSSKRSRAAEVHNLSEKRRRSRINEKIKALQMLIPNSNKTDKASMLDEAIEYLKELQLQVQTLSMRNGLNPVYVPGALQSIQLSHRELGFEDGHEEFNGNQGTQMQSTFDVPNQNQPNVIPTTTRISNSEISFGLEPSIPVHYGSFNLSAPSMRCLPGRSKTMP